MRNDKRKGVAFCRNQGIKYAKGDFITFLDDDDCWTNEKLKLQLNTFLSLNKESFLFCNDFSIRSKKTGWDSNVEAGFISFNRNKFYLAKSFPPPSTWFLSRNIISKIGYFDEKLVVYEDLDYLVRILEFFPAYYLNEVLVKSGYAMKHLSSLSEDSIEAREYFLKKHFSKIENDKHYYYRFCYALAKDYFKIGFRNKARKWFLKALKIKPYKIEVIAKFTKTFYK